MYIFYIISSERNKKELLDQDRTQEFKIICCKFIILKYNQRKKEEIVSVLGYFGGVRTKMQLRTK